MMKAYKEYESVEAYKQAVHATDSIGECTRPPAPKPGKDTRYVFISYSHKDYKKVFCDLADLYESGIPFWYDDRLRAGTTWYEDARTILSAPNCVGVIFFISQDFFASDAIKKEISMTLGGREQLPKDYFCVNLTDKKPSELYETTAKGDWKKLLASAFRDEDTYLCFGEPEHARRLIEQVSEVFGIESNSLLYDLGRARNGNGTFEFEHGSVYTGPFACGKFEGLGQLSFAGTPFYDGQWKDGKPHGLGIRTCANGTVFVGEWVNGRLCGSGIRIGSNGMAHYGNWVAGKLEGFGAIIGFEGTVLTGKWADGKAEGALTLSDRDELPNSWVRNIACGSVTEAQADQEGHGVLRFSSGSVYRGQIHRNRPHGQGRMEFDDGSVYTGEWISGIPHGQGEMIYSDQDVYKGQWGAGLPHGKGKITYWDGDTYEGDWKAGMRDGYGVMRFFLDGESAGGYTGQWADDEPEGSGTMTYEDGAVYEGKWKDGQWHGQGMLTLADGTKYIGRFENGTFDDSQTE